MLRAAHRREAYLHSWSTDARKWSLALSQVICTASCLRGFSMWHPSTGRLLSQPCTSQVSSGSNMQILWLCFCYYSNFFSAFSFTCHDSEDCVAHRRAASVGLGALKTRNALQWVWSCTRVAVAKNMIPQLDRREEAMDLCMLCTEFTLRKSTLNIISHYIHTSSPSC